MRYVKLLVQIGIGLAVLLWLLQLADVSMVLSIILSLNPMYLILASGFFITASVMVALALYVALKRSGLSPSPRKVIMASFGGQLLSDVTPARSGYFLTPFILNEMDNTPIKSGMAGVVATGAINFFVKAALSIIALAYFVRTLPLKPVIVNTLLVGISLLIAGGLGLLMLIWGRRIPRLVERLKKLPVLGKAMGRIVEALNHLQEEGKKVRGSLTQIALLILLSVVVNATALYFVSSAIWRGSPSLLDFILIVPLASTLMYVPITIAGLGVQEGGYVILLTLLGTPLEEAIAFTLIVRLLFTGTDIIGLQPLLKVGLKAPLKSKRPV